MGYTKNEIILGKFLATIENPNSKTAYDSLFNSLLLYCSRVNKDLDTFTKADIDDFFKKSYPTVTVTTISNRMSQTKKLFKSNILNKGSIVSHLSLSYISNIVNIKECKIYTPQELLQAIDKLKNPMDKALIILIYHGFYNKDFETIINLRRDDVGDDYVLKGTEKITLPKYCMDILKSAAEQEIYERYDIDEKAPLSYGSPYLIRCLHHSSRRGKVSCIFLRKKMASLAEYLEDEDFSAVAIKNSKHAYQFIRGELGNGFSDRTPILELKDYCIRNGIKMYVERISIAKEKIKDQIICEIRNEFDIGLCR